MMLFILLAILGLEPVHQMGYRGEGVTMAIIDAGFFRATDSTVFDQSHILGTYDLLPDSLQAPGMFATPSDYHGTCCLSTILYEKDGFVGTAPDASVYLIRTEYSPREDTTEVSRLIRGLYLADSLDVDIISISLGYWDMDDTLTSFHYEDMDGTSPLSQAATDVAQRRIVCVSAGNDGEKGPKRHYISTPADAQDVLTVGAVDSTGQAARFSSYGPTYDGRQKPELVAWGQKTMVYLSRKDASGQWTGGMQPGNGTSFAAPEIAGMMACLKQALPTRSPAELRQAAIASCEFTTPDAQRGYGRPNAARALEIATELTSQASFDPNTGRGVKIEKGQVIIERNGVKYTILGKKM